MPLHLLGKKSWNVYNADNIDRVRRDEAHARKEKEAEGQRLQEADAEQRLAILRGELPPNDDDGVQARLGARQDDHANDERGNGSGWRGEKRKRKRHGEDDTDFEMRVAREQHDERYGLEAAKRARTSSAPIVGRDGHIDLFGADKAPSEGKGADGPPKDALQNMKFADAGGKNDKSRVAPWYTSRLGTRDAVPDRFEATNVWGKDDPSRKERQMQRISSGDPLLMMKSGAKRAREVGQDRKRERDERARDLDALVRDSREAAERREPERREHIPTYKEDINETY